MSKWQLYTTQHIKPQGWLRRQLEIQARGLSGNLDLVWRDVRDSAWIGGDAEGWERVPYWLDGFIPLAYLLEDEQLIARAKKYINAILAAQRPDGWICPCAEEDIPTYDSWAVQLIGKVLTVYYQCSGDDRIPGALYRIHKNYYDLLSSSKIQLFKWGKFRWFETFIALDMLYKMYGEEWIRKLAHILREQGADYASFTDRWCRYLNKWTFETHIVNLGMMLKYEAVSCDLLGEEYTDRAETLRALLDKYNGTPTELFTGDECLAGLSPIHGTELCAVVEQMYSYELLYAYTGDKKWAERLEVIAFNALPATISDDMWAHQYVQLSNQIDCRRFPGKPPFTTNSAESHVFGLEPNYGCCTANFNQGWPKLALSAFMHSGDTILSALPIPSVLTDHGIRISLSTDYPFNNSFVYDITADRPFTLKVRVPSFAEGLTVDGEAVALTDMLSFDIAPGKRTVSISYDATPHIISRPYGLNTVKCGSLLFSLPIKYNTKLLEYVKKDVERKFPYCDYEYTPASDWNYGYCDSPLTLERRGVGDVPFSSEQPPLVVKTQTCHIDWGLEEGYENLCAKIPQSTAPLDAPAETELYPYGCTKLRMTELPIVK